MPILINPVQSFFKRTLYSNIIGEIYYTRGKSKIIHIIIIIKNKCLLTEHDLIVLY